MKRGSAPEVPGQVPAAVPSGICFAVDGDGGNSILRALPIAVLITEAATGKVLEANAATLALFGLERSAILGKTLSEAGVDVVIDYGVGGRKGSRAQEAIVTDCLGTRLSCRLISSTAEIAGQRAVISVILDSQLQSVLLGRGTRSRQAKAKEAPEKRGPQGVRSSLALLADPSDSNRESAVEMLKMLGLTVSAGSGVGEAIAGIPQGLEPSLVVVDSSLLGNCADIADRYRSARVIVAVSGPYSRDEVIRRGWLEVPKPFSINELASAVSKALG